MNRIVPGSSPVAEPVVGVSTRAKICLVTGDLAGLIVNAGVGTANRAMAVMLQRLGYDVDVLYTRVDKGIPFTDRGQFIDHVEDFRKSGIRLMCLDNGGSWNDWPAVSYLSMQHLLHHQYQLAFFDEMDGNAFYSLLARCTGNSKLRATKICVTTHASRQWFWDVNQRPFTLDDLSLMEMERRSVELADAIKSPSAYLLQKYRDYGWKLPNDSIVLPNFVATEGGSVCQTRKPAIVKELVFFGRLEARKGLWMFCRALERIKYNLKNVRVTFLGRSVIEDGVSTTEKLIKMSAGWPFAIQIITNFDRPQALDYLQGPGRVAVMPGLEDNSPSTILECIEAGIPFIACDSGGAPELLNDEARKLNLFGPSVDELSAKLREIIFSGGVTARASFDQEGLRARFSEWIERLLRPDINGHRPRAARQRQVKPVLMIIVPPDFEAAKAVTELRRTHDEFGGDVEMHVLAAHTAELKREITSVRELESIQFSDLNGFQKVARLISSRPPTVLGLCHITQMLSPSWIERARRCFEMEEDISALTGMVGGNDNKNVPSNRETYVSVLQKCPQIEEYLVGNAPPLFPLFQVTNSGFALLRSELFASLAASSPVDDQYGRVKQMDEWIHEILVALHAAGKRFELVPDQVMQHEVAGLPFESLRLGQFMRSLPDVLYSYAPGTDQWLLSRLVIDASLEDLRSRIHTKYLKQVADRIGTELVQLHQFAPWEQQVQQLVKVAHGLGQIDLAVELSASMVVPNVATPRALTEYVISAAAAMVGAVNLALLFDRGEFTALNIRNQQPTGDWRAFDLPTNPAGEGVASLLFQSVNLSDATHFSCLIDVLDQTAGPVQFSIDVASLDKTSHWSANKIVRDGKSIQWELEVPTELRGLCIVRLGVEVAHWKVPAASIMTRWTDPLFLQRN